MSSRRKAKTADAGGPPPGAKPLTFGGYTAYYTEDELYEMSTLPSTPEGEKVARLIHEGKVFGDATLLRTAA